MKHYISLLLLALVVLVQETWACLPSLTLSLRSKDTVVFLDSKVRISVKSSPLDSIVSFKWMVQGKVVAETKGPVLEIPHASYGDMGVYTCQAINSCGEQATSDSMKVYVYKSLPVVCGDSVIVVTIPVFKGDTVEWDSSVDIRKRNTTGDTIMIAAPRSEAVLPLSFTIKPRDGSRLQTQYMYIQGGSFLNFSVRKTQQDTVIIKPQMIIGLTASLSGSYLTDDMIQWEGSQLSKSYGHYVLYRSPVGLGVVDKVRLFTTSEWGCVSRDSIIFKTADITIQADSITIDVPRHYKVGDVMPVVVSVWPMNATGEPVLWSSDSSVLQLTDSRIFARAAGSCYVYARLDSRVDSLRVDVETYIPVESVDVIRNASLHRGDTLMLTTLVHPNSATTKSLNFMSSDASIATVDYEGRVVAQRNGMALVTVMSPEGAKATCLVTVADTLNVVTRAIMPDTVRIPVGESALVYPDPGPGNIFADNMMIGIGISPFSRIHEYTPHVFTAEASGGIQFSVMFGDESHQTVEIIGTKTTPPVITNLPKMSLANAIGASDSLDLTRCIDTTIEANKNVHWFIRYNNLSSTQVELRGTVLVARVLSQGVARGIVDLVVINAEGNSRDVEVLVTVGESSRTENSDLTNQVVTATQGSAVIDFNMLLKGTLYSVTGVSVYEKNTLVKDTKLVVKGIQRDTLVELLIVTHAKDTIVRNVRVVVDKRLSNKPPQLIACGEQLCDSSGFRPLLLNSLVNDDFTPPEKIVWTFAQSSNILLPASNGIVMPRLVNSFWYGTETILFTAEDEQGGRSVMPVTFVRKPTTTTTTWHASPNLNFVTSPRVITPGYSISFDASIYGADDQTQILWKFPGSAHPESSDLHPSVRYQKFGRFPVTLIASNTYGVDTLDKQDYITVAGIFPRSTRLCWGTNVTVVAIGRDNLKYTWADGSTQDRRSFVLKHDTTLVLTIRNGIQTITDTVRYTVTRPLDLGPDTTICAGSSIELGSLQPFARYLWSNGAHTSTINARNVGNYVLTVTDDKGCTSSDTLSIRALLPLPVVNLGNDTTVCGGTRVSLDAGAGMKQYRWSNGEVVRSITVDSTSVSTVTVTDGNGCSSVDSVKLAVLWPYQEAISLATYTDDGKNIVVAWTQTPGKRTLSYTLVRKKLDSPGAWDTLVTRTRGDSLYYIDRSVKAIQQQYSYKLLTTDSNCNNQAQSPVHTTMLLLKQTGIDNHTVNLTWYPYEGIAVKSYTLVHLHEGIWDTIGSVLSDPSKTTLSFVHDSYQPGDNYRVVFKLDKRVVVSNLKSDGGPYSYSLSNMAESKLLNRPTLTTEEICVYPSPAKRSFVLRAPAGTRFYICNSLGVLVYEGTASEQKTPIQCATWIAGEYYVMVVGVDGVDVKNMVVE